MRELREDPERYVAAARLDLVQVGPMHADAIRDLVLR